MDPMFSLHRRDQLEDFESDIVISRPGSDEPIWDGQQWVVGRDEVYAGRCRLRSQGSNATVVQAGDQPFTLRTYDVHVPPSVIVVLDDKIVVTACPDAAAVGTSLRVIDVPHTEWFTVRHLVAVEEAS